MKRSGFTLVEVLIVMVIGAILIAIAVPSFERYLDRTRVSEAKVDVDAMGIKIRQYDMSKGVLPDSLDDVGFADKRDPWGQPYQYLNVRDAKNASKARKDKKSKPLNSDFDLYSIGPDGVTQPSLTKQASRDDVLRARDGRFVGRADEFDP